MRMRKKPNLEPRMAACADWLITKPEELAGRWREAFPGYDEVWIELGCGKGRFTAETAKAEPNTLLIAVERVPDAMVVAMERAKAENIENVRFIDIDAARLTEIFAPGEADGIYINFPDPWKKSRQAKRRLTAPATEAGGRDTLQDRQQAALPMERAELQPERLGALRGDDRPARGRSMRHYDRLRAEVR